MQRYSKLYGIQQLYAEQQRRTLKHATSAMMTITGNPFKAAPKDFGALGERVRQLRADLLVEEQIGKRLSEEYRKTLH